MPMGYFDFSVCCVLQHEMLKEHVTFSTARIAMSRQVAYLSFRKTNVLFVEQN